MREKPIIFNGEMVRAIIDGRKTQTRRVIKPQPNGAWAAPGRTMCPYGQPGDRLWVRETWSHPGNDSVCQYIYRADWIGDSHDNYVYDCYESQGCPVWRPSIHMPKKAARIWLEITGIRVKRVRAMMNRDAKAEGVRKYVRVGPDQDGLYYQDWVDPFKQLWDSINKKRGYAWDSNPWVWVIEFRRLQRGNVNAR